VLKSKTHQNPCPLKILNFDVLTKRKLEKQTLRLTTEFNIMKVAYKLAALLSIGSLITVSASAKSASETYLDTCSKNPSIPVPISVITPQISAGYADQTVNVEFTVDTTGTPTGLIGKSSPDEQLSEAVVEAVKQWKFIPAHRSGEAVAARVALPVHIVAKDTFSSYAAN